MTASTIAAGLTEVVPAQKGRQAKAKVRININDGSSFRELTSPAISDRGSGYNAAPQARIISALGSGAEPRLTFSGIDVVHVSMSDGGENYSDDATLVIDPPRLHDLATALINPSIDTIQLEDGLYFENTVIRRDVIIRGQGINRTTISGGLLGSIFKIVPGVTVTLQDLTLVDGLAPNGGAIDNDGGILSLERCEIRNCRAYGLLGEGGAIWNHGPARLTLIDCQIHDNAASRDGGGISNSGINTARLLTARGLEVTNVLRLVSTNFATFNAPTNATDQTYNTTVAGYQETLGEMLDAIGDLPSLFGPIGTNNFTPSPAWSALGMPTMSISNCAVYRNKTGKGAANSSTIFATYVPYLIGYLGPYPDGSVTPVFDTQRFESSPRDPRLLAFGAGVHNDLGLLVVQDSRLTENDNDTDLASYGGAISSVLGVTRVLNSELSSNNVHATTVMSAGGALYSFASIVKISDAQLNTNRAMAGLFMASGGAVKSTALSYVEMERCRMDRNVAGGGGGVANDYLAFLNLKDSWISGNSISGVTGAEGGGVRNEEGGNMLLVGCTISGNTVKGLAKGGGVYNQCESTTNLYNPIRIATATLQNCTISGNIVDGRGPFGVPFDAQGAGLYNGSAEFAVANMFVSACTIVSNTASGGLLNLGGGYYNTALSTIKLLKPKDSRPGFATVQVANNIFAQNTPEDCFNNFLTLGALTVSLGYNMDSDASGAIAALPSDGLLSNGQYVTAPNPGLGALQSNGGPTPTHALLAQSPAIDSGSTSGAAENASLNADQRGVARSLGGRRDIGALESIPPLIAPETCFAIEDHALIVPGPGVLANDFGDGQLAVLASAPAHGQLVLSPTGGFTYTSAENFTGTDTFSYTVLDSRGRQTASAVTTLSVMPRLDFLGMTPVPGTFAERNTAIRLSFDEPVTMASVDRNVSIVGAISGAMSFWLSSNANTVTLLPSRDFERGEQVTIAISDGLRSAGGSVLAPKVVPLQFTVFPNRVPIATAQTVTVQEDTPMAQSLSFGTDPDGDGVHVTDVVHRGTLGLLIRLYGNVPTTYEGGAWPDGYYVYRQPAPVINGRAEHGTYSLQADGTFTYRPDTNFFGTDAIEFEVTDGSLRSSSAILTIQVDALNDPPVAGDDHYGAYTWNVSAAEGVLSNDHDVEGSALSAQLLTPPSHGFVTLRSDGSFNYVPVGSFAGADVFTYQATDGTDFSAARVKIGNTLPEAIADIYFPVPGQTLTNAPATGVLANDLDIDGDPLVSARVVVLPRHGVLNFNADGSFTYTANTGYSGTDEFRYVVSDGLADSPPARVKMGNTAPVAQDDSGYLAFPGQSLDVNSLQGVLANDLDADNDPTLTAVLVSAPSHGTLTLTADGSFSYLAQGGFIGDDHFTYVVSDGLTQSPEATVTLQVRGVLRVTQQVPGPNSATLPPGSAIQVGFSAPVDSTNLQGKVVIHGSMSGRREFSITVQDHLAILQPWENFIAGEVVRVSVLPGIMSTSGVATDRSFSWSFTVAAIRGGARFAAGLPFTEALVRRTSAVLGDFNGDGYPDVWAVNYTNAPTLRLNNQDGTFTTRSEALGMDAFQSLVRMNNAVAGDFNGDGKLDVISNGQVIGLFGFLDQTARVGLNDGTGQFPTYTTLPVVPDSFVTGDFDGDGDDDLFAVDRDTCWLLRNDGAAHFTLDSTTELSIGTNFEGIAAGDLDADGDLDLMFSGPILEDHQNVLINDGSGHFTLRLVPSVSSNTQALGLGDLDGDTDLDALLSYSAGLPDLWFNNGMGEFPIQRQTLRAPSCRSITLADFNGDGALDAWFAKDDGSTFWLNNGSGGFSTNGPPVTGLSGYAAAAADFDQDGDLDVYVVGSNQFGNLAQNPDQIWMNQAHAIARDDLYAASSGTITISATQGVLANDSPGDGGSMTASLLAPPSHGSVTLQPDGGFSYTPDGSFSGTDVFTYQAVDSQSTSAVARVKIGNSAATPTPDGPFTVINDEPLRVPAPGVLANDSDTEGDPLKATLVSATSHGTLVLKPSGAIIYTPVPGYVGPDSFTYAVNDGVSDSVPTTVTLNVFPRLSVASLNPPANSVGIGSATGFVAEFNRPLNPASIAGQVHLHSHEIGPISFQTRVDARNLTILPADVLRYGDRVTLTLGVGLQGISTEHMGAPLTAEFHVESPTSTGILADSGERIGDSSNNAFSVVLGDLDKDGDLDAVATSLVFNNGVTSGPGTTRIFFNTGSGPFLESSQSIPGPEIGATLADLDGDGDLDLIPYPGAFTTTPSQIWMNDGTGHFTGPTQTLGQAFRIFAADFDGDGDLDLFRLYANSASVWFNDGQGHFSENPASVADLSFVGRSINAGVMGDIDGDGDLDIVARQSFTTQPMLIFLNDGHGTFTDSGRQFGAGGTAIAMGDVNGDGFPDLFAPSNNGSYLWLNDGSGVFTDSGNLFDPYSPNTVQLHDMDGDRDLDAVVIQSQTLASGGRTNTSTIYLNNGSGTFSPSGLLLGAFLPPSTSSLQPVVGIGIGDVDGSGSVDVILPVPGGSPNEVWSNRSALGSLQGVANTTVDSDSAAHPFASALIHASANSVVTVTITVDAIAQGTFSTLSLAASEFTGPSGNTYSLVGASPSAAQSALRQLLFVPTPNRTSVGSTEVTTFTVVVSDDTISRTNISTVAVTSVNDAPLAVTDQGTGFSTTESTAFTTANVLSNDSDPDVADLISVVRIDTSGTVGTISDLGHGTFHYDPAGRLSSLPEGVAFIDSFTYVIRDLHGAESFASVNITVNGVNQAPGTQDDNVTVIEGSGPVTLTGFVLSNDTDGDTGDALRFTIASVNTDGTRGQVQWIDGDIRYDPAGIPNLAAGSSTTDAFGYTITDGHGGTASGLVHITVEGINDPPALQPDFLVLRSDALVTNVTDFILSNDQDPDPAETSSLRLVALDTSATRGQATISTNFLVSYQPTNFAYLRDGESTNDTFKYLVADGHGLQSTGLVHVAIIGTNDAPLTALAHIVFEKAGPERDITAELLAYDSDPDGLASDLAIVDVTPGSTALGMLTFTAGRVKYSPNPGLSLRNGEVATDTFRYTLRDPLGASAEGMVTVYVVGQNAAPLADAALFSLNEDQVYSGAVTGFDADGDPLTFAVATPPPHGTVQLDPDGHFTYRPAQDFSGEDSFSFTVKDASEESAPAEVKLTVNPVNDVPDLTVASAVIAVDEGFAAQTTGSWSDRDDDDVTLSASIGSVDRVGGTWTWQWLTRDGPAESQDVVITADDGHGGIVTSRFHVTVSDLPARLTSATNVTGYEDAAFSVPIAFTDPGVLDRHSATFDWGDGTPVVAGTVIESNGAGQMSGAHAYAEPGRYILQACLSDVQSTLPPVCVEVDVTVIPGFLTFAIFGGVTDAAILDASTATGHVGSRAMVTLGKMTRVSGGAASYERSVALADSGQIGSFVLSAQSVTLGKASLVGQSITAGSDVLLADAARVLGNVTAGGNLVRGKNTSVGGVVLLNQPVPPPPPLSWPNLELTSGGANIPVGKSATRTVVPGSYGILDAKDASRINLTAGHYSFAQFSMGKSSRLALDLTGGPIVIDVTGNLVLGDATQMMAVLPAGRGPADILFRVNGAQVNLGTSGTYLGTFLAPGATIQVKDSASLRGAAYGAAVRFGKSTTTVYQPAVELVMSLLFEE